jgi:trans-aconitate methyltransferase
MNITWDEQHYENNFSFVHGYGEAVLGLLDVKAGARVLDLGYGNGALTKALEDRGYRALGLDDSAEMIAGAKAAYPDLTFVQANAIDFALDEPVEAVFSNAVLHWIGKKDQPALLASVARALMPSGQFVFECGGFGNAHLIHSALRDAFAKRGLGYRIPQYFPTIGEYASMLESAGFKVVFATLFDRFTPLLGDDGLANWIRTFQQSAFVDMEDTLREEIIREAVDSTRAELFVDNVWYADYVRLRMKAIKLGERANEHP